MQIGKGISKWLGKCLSEGKAGKESWKSTPKELEDFSAIFDNFGVGRISSGITLDKENII